MRIAGLCFSMSLLGGLGPSTPLSAQTDESSFCFRPGRLESCRSFLIFELRGQVPLLQTDRIVDTHSTFDDAYYTQRRQELGGTVSWDVGYAVNVNERWAVGATAVVGLSGDTDRAEGSLHFRRWFSDQVAIEVRPGIARHVVRDDTSEIGYNLGVRVHAWDVVLGLRYEALDMGRRVDVYDRIGGGGVITKTDPGGIEHMLSAGIGLESASALLASLVGLALIAVGLSND